LWNDTIFLGSLFFLTCNHHLQFCVELLMPQMSLPIFPSEVTYITPELAFAKVDGTVTYFNGFMPVFSHSADDIRSFRMITAQFCETGHVKQSEIARAFGIPLISVKRAVKRYRTSGPAGFFHPRPKRGPTILTEDVLLHAQRLIDEGDTMSAVGEKLGIKVNTLNKAAAQGRLHRSRENISDATVAVATTRSQRSVRDGQAEMGMGATNALDRVCASVGCLGQGVETRFEPWVDIPNGGLLLAVPSLMVCGLLRFTDEHFSYPAG
jgi:hypothetical protein